MGGGMKMQKSNKIILKKAGMLFLTLIIVFFVFIQYVQAVSGPTFYSYQGRLLNANGVPVSDTTVDVIFEFYDAVSGGTCLWSNSSATCATTTARSVTLTDGLFSENLGDTGDSYAAISESVFADNASVFLQVTIEGETLSPRKQFTSTPWATNATRLNGIASSGFFQLTANNTVTGTNDLTSALFAGTNALRFDGSTSGDSVETTLAFADPTLDRTITFKDESGTVAFLSDLGWTDSGTTVYATTSTDSVAVGGSAATSATFGVVPTTGYVYLGDSSINPVLYFKDATAGSGTITYNNDHWEFTGGDITHNSSVTYASAPGDSYGISSTSITSASAGGGAGTYGVYQLFAQVNNTSVENLGYDQAVTALGGSAINSGTGVMNQVRGASIQGINSSTAGAAIESGVYGVYSEVYNIGAGSTVPTAIALYGKALAHDGTVTSAYGVQGLVHTSTGTVTNAYAGDFDATYAGTNRYGVRAGASGGTKNYAGYFYGSAVHVDNSSTPSTPLYATGSGDLYVYDQIEVDGTNQTSSIIVDVAATNLTTGMALSITRNDSGTDFTGLDGLVKFAVDDVGSTGHTLYLQNGGTGSSLFINQLGDQKALQVQGLGTTDYLASFFNDGNADTNMGISIQACLDTNPTAACNYLLFMDGNGTALGVIEGTGGGVAFNSPGSDYAELFPGAMSSFSEGDILALDTSGTIKLADSADGMIGTLSVMPNSIGNWFDGWEIAGTHVPVALLGQVPVTVNMEGGAIAAGDFVTLSATSGVAKKATGVGYVLGQALESHTGGTGIIQVYVKPTWQAIGVLTDAGSMTLVSDDLALSATGVANASAQGMDSYGLMMRGSGWDGAVAQDVSLGFVTHVTNANEYRLSFEDQDENELAFVNQDGDLALAGKLYPSDRGALQTDKYIYYDGSSGLGGDFMRTNASGWGSGSYDFAEMFPAIGSIAPGEVVVFALDEESVMRSTGTTYDQKIAGIVSTQPGFLAGQNIEGHIPVALAGRVPTYVSSENGAIAVGDPLTTSSKPGYTMKATEPGQIVGYAMETFSGDSGSIIAFVRPSYFDGSEIDVSDNTLSELIPSSSLDLSGIMNLNGGSLISVDSLAGIGDLWSIDGNGTFRTGDRYVQEVRTYGGEKVETYAMTSPQTTIQLSGTIELDEGRAHVYFDDFDENFADIISLTASYRVFLTAHDVTGSLYAINRENDGFIIRDTEGTSHVDVDWLVIAYHKDFEPEEDMVEDVIAQEEDSSIGDVDQDSAPSIPSEAEGSLESDTSDDEEFDAIVEVDIEEIADEDIEVESENEDEPVDALSALFEGVEPEVLDESVVPEADAFDESIDLVPDVIDEPIIEAPVETTEPEAVAQEADL